MSARSVAMRLIRSRRGMTVVEFGILAPTMMIIIMGLSDMLYQSYTQSLLSGAIQKAGRDSSIQGNNSTAATAALDAKVVSMVGAIVKNLAPSCATNPAASTYCSTRRSYTDFQSMTPKPEPFIDNNHNGVRNPGECFTDINGNGTWDASADAGNNSQGGADDVTLYTMSITYPRIFPVMTLLGMPATQTISASTLLKNQPYATQTVATPATVCT